MLINDYIHVIVVCMQYSCAVLIAQHSWWTRTNIYF